MPKSNHELIPGSYADVKLHFVRRQKSFTVPASAVVTTLERKFGIKISGDTTQWIDIRTGFNMDDKQEIFADLQEGHKLAFKSNEELKQGKKVMAVIQSKN